MACELDLEESVGRSLQVGHFVVGRQHEQRHNDGNEFIIQKVVTNLAGMWGSSWRSRRKCYLRGMC